MKKQTRPNYFAITSDDYSISIENCIEVMGHDDSLPYNAHVIVYKGCSKYFEFDAWNDGWGGNSCLEILQSDIEKANEINAWCEKELTTIYNNGLTLKGTLDCLVDSLAYMFIDCDVRGFISINNYKKMEKKQLKRIGGKFIKD